MAMPDLTQAILRRTSGTTCATLRERACAYVDGELEGLAHQLVAAHLDHCRDCTALMVRLRVAQADLPRFRAPDPGPWFTAKVLRSCSELPNRPDSLVWRLFHRPRIALEAATLGAALGTAGLWFPMPGPNEGPKSLPVAQALAPVRSSVGALAQGLHAVTRVFHLRKPNPRHAGEPSGIPVRSSFQTRTSPT
jgi:anti-sigma factor RsiW